MQDSFDGTETIILQPGDSAKPRYFTFAICTSQTANDGAIPYGTTISSVAVKAFDDGGTDVTAQMVDASSQSGTVVTVDLNYPTSAGRYSLEFELTLDSGAVLEFDFTRVYAEDIAA